MATQNPAPTSSEHDAAEALSARIARARDVLKARARNAEAIRKALGEVDSEEKLQRLDLVSSCCQTLKSTDFAEDFAADDVAALTEELGRHLTELRRRGRTAILQALSKAASEEGLGLEVLSETPLVVQLAPFTVEMDVDAGRAQLQYARERVTDTPLEAAAILLARRTAIDDIRAESLDAAGFFALLHQAYRVVLVTTNAKPGERVDLVDLLAPLSLCRVETARWRRTSMKRLSDYPRYLLAYQLNRLRREGQLEQSGWRIELGTATGGSTRNKQNVLFLPLSPADGQYYLSIRFVPS